MTISAPTKGRNTARLKTQVSNPVTSTVLLLYDDHEDYGQNGSCSEKQLSVVLNFSGLDRAKTLARGIRAAGGGIDGTVNGTLIDPLVHPSPDISSGFSGSVYGSIYDVLVEPIGPFCDWSFDCLNDYVIVKMVKIILVLKDCVSPSGVPVTFSQTV